LFKKQSNYFSSPEMIFLTRFFSLPLFVLLFSTTIAQGTCGNEIGSCAAGYCCSKYGYCGTTDDYCNVNNGCQASFGAQCVTIPLKTPCGIESENGNKSCAALFPGQGYCCSKYGYCGSTFDYCDISAGCQGGAFGASCKDFPMPQSKAGVPCKIYAPYVDVASDANYFNGDIFDVANISSAHLQQWFSLAFITSDDNGNPIFGNKNISVASKYYFKKLMALRENGGDFILSFGKYLNH
jgi:hypothetical protein